MMADTILISDSSDDESPPKKKIKIDKKEEKENNNISQDIVIVDVKSLSNSAKKPAPPNSEIYIIVDDDENDCQLNDHGVNSCSSKNNNENIKHSIVNGELNKKEDEEPKPMELKIEKKDESTAAEIVELDTITDETSAQQDTKTSDNVIENANGECSKDNNLLQPSCSKNIDLVHNEIIPEFENFLKVCATCQCASKYKDLIIKKTGAIYAKYQEANPAYISCKSFRTMLQNSISKVERKPADAILVFHDIYSELAARKHKDVVLTERENKNVKKLNKFLSELGKKIKKLEAAEVDFDDEENSSYMMLERYRTRFCSIYKKLCSYTKENVYAGRTMYRKLDFDISNYPVINRAVDSMYHKKKEFPTFHDVDKCIRKCVTENNLPLSGEYLDSEIRKIFSALGKLLQRRRKTELQDTLADFLDNTNDPASEDSSLDAVLAEQYQTGEQKIEAVMQQYTDKQEKGEDCVEESGEETPDEEEESNDSPPPSNSDV